MFSTNILSSCLRSSATSNRRCSFSCSNSTLFHLLSHMYLRVVTHPNACITPLKAHSARDRGAAPGLRTSTRIFFHRFKGWQTNWGCGDFFFFFYTFFGVLLLQLMVPIITCCGRPRWANRAPPSCTGRMLAPRRRAARGRRLAEEFCWPSMLAIICSSTVTFLHRRCCSLWNWSRAFIAHIYAWSSEVYREQQSGWFKRKRYHSTAGIWSRRVLFVSLLLWSPWRPAVLACVSTYCQSVM